MITLYVNCYNVMISLIPAGEHCTILNYIIYILTYKEMNPGLQSHHIYSKGMSANVPTHIRIRLLLDLDFLLTASRLRREDGYGNRERSGYVGVVSCRVSPT